MRILFRKSLKDVTQRKLRAGLTIVGIAIGVMGLTAVNVATSQLQASINFTNSTSGQADITFVTEPAHAALAQRLAEQANVQAAQAETQGFGKWLTATSHISLSLTGYDNLNDVAIGKFQLTQGKLPGHGEILLESNDSALSPVHVGDEITAQVAGHAEHLRVSGLTRTSGLGSPATTQVATGYMRADDLQAMLGVSGENIFLVKLNDYGQRQTTAKQLAPIFAEQGVRVLDASVGRNSDSGQQTINGLFSVMSVLSVVAALLGALLLISVITTLIGEQTAIIGTMKALGGRRGQILRAYLTTVLIYGVAGTILGMALGVGLGLLLFSVFASIFTLDAVPLALTPTIVVVSVLVGIGVPLLAALAPIVTGVRITVRQALSGYGLSNGSGTGGGWSAAIGRAFGFLPQTAQLGMRSLFRRRTRAALTLLALALSGAAFMAVETTADSFNHTLANVFNTYNADVFTGLTQAASYANVRQTLSQPPGVAQTEPLQQSQAQAQWGSVLLEGVIVDPHLYNKQMVSGRWFTAGDSNVVVISQDAADKSKLHIGDVVSLHTSLNSARWTIIGIAKDYNGITASGVALAPLAQVDALAGLPADYANVTLIRSSSARPADVSALAVRVDDALSAAGYQDQTQTVQQLKAKNEGAFTIIYGLLYAVAAIIALVGAIGLFNALAMSVLERRREIGILRSMGARGGQVARVFMTEGLTLGSLAWLVALIVGIPAAYAFVQLLGRLFLKSEFTFNPVSVALMLVFILAVATLASVIPVWGAARVKIAQTLRYE